MRLFYEVTTTLCRMKMCVINTVRSSLLYNSLPKKKKKKRVEILCYICPETFSFRHTHHSQMAQGIKWLNHWQLVDSFPFEKKPVGAHSCLPHRHMTATVPRYMWRCLDATEVGVTCYRPVTRYCSNNSAKQIVEK